MSVFADPYALFDVRGKVALVVGATGAFGSVAAKTLAGAGCKVMLTAGTPEALQAVADACTDLGADVNAINARPETEAVSEKMIAETVEKYGQLDILVVASGINKISPIEEMAPDTFTGVMDVNVTQSWLMARAAARQMKAQGRGGRIILVSSARGLLGHPAGYTALHNPMLC